jgi:hypothetical protein
VSDWHVVLKDTPDDLVSRRDVLRMAFERPAWNTLSLIEAIEMLPGTLMMPSDALESPTAKEKRK